MSLRWVHIHFVGFVMRQLNLCGRNTLKKTVGESGYDHTVHSYLVFYQELEG